MGPQTEQTRGLFLSRGRRVLDKDNICSTLSLAVGGQCVHTCTCMLRHPGTYGQGGPETSCSQWVLLDSTPDSIWRFPKATKLKCLPTGSSLPGPFHKEGADCVPYKGPAARALEVSWSTRSLLREVSWSPEGQKGQVTGDTGAESKPNHAGLKTPHPVAAPEAAHMPGLGSCCLGWRNSSLEWEALCSLAQPRPRGRALGKGRESA